MQNGLSHNTVKAIAKDKRGFMWFGTEDGLNRFDGYRIYTYKADRKAKGSIPAASINTLYNDKAGTLWVGTNGGGLSKYDPGSDQFISYIQGDDAAAETLTNNAITAIDEDSKGNLWIGTYWGLNYLNVKTMVVHRHYNSDYDSSITHNSISSVVVDNKDNVWVATKEGGLNYMKSTTSQVTRFLHDPSNINSVASNNVLALAMDRKGQLWVGTEKGVDMYYEGRFTHFDFANLALETPIDKAVFSILPEGDHYVWLGIENNGLKLFDYQRNIFVPFVNNDDDTDRLAKESTVAIYKDNTEILWLGTSTQGVVFLDRNEAPFEYVKTSSKLVNCFEEVNGKIWIGLDGGGIDIFDPKSQTLHQFKGNELLSSATIVCEYKDRAGNLWIGTYGGGLQRYNVATGEMTTYKQGQGKNELNNNSIFSILEDKDGLIWLATLGGGVNLLDPVSGEIQKFRSEANNPKALQNDYISSLLEDHDGKIWIGTFGSGVSIYDKKQKEFVTYNSYNGKLTNDLVSVMLQDKLKRIWLGTMGGGLNSFNSGTGQVKVYRADQGLPNDFIHSIEEDDKGNLWISTNSGLSKFNTANETFINYDGLDGSEFRRGASFRSMHGELYFGGVKGFNVFTPDSIRGNKHIPPVVITEFQIFNKLVSPHDEGSPLKSSTFTVQDIDLNYDQSVFTFEFAALSFTSSFKNKYAYKLEGFDKDWNYVGGNRRATYTNLDPGSYTFKVIASNNDGLWNEEGTSISIYIAPPFWKTWWFKSGLFLLISTGIYLLIRIKMHNFRRQKTMLEEQVRLRTSEVTEQKTKLEEQAKDLLALNEEQQSLNEELKALNEELQSKTEFLEKLNEQLQLQKEETNRKRMEAEESRREAERANQAKTIFLATMSHEIRTPMNGVLGMASLLSETSLSMEQREYTETIVSSGEALLTVINDILDFSKIESGKMELEKHAFDLRQCVENVMDLFSTAAAKKGLDLIYEIDYQVPANVVGDSHRLRQILINLVSNAVKFTNAGEVFLSVSQLKNDDATVELVFNVKDTGIGIAEDKLKRLFQPFSQVDSSTTRQYGGTGLGLAICHRLVELMDGRIEVDSKVGGGTTFSFIVNLVVSHIPVRHQVFSKNGSLEGKKALIVDDNKTNLTILRNLMKHWQIDSVVVSSPNEALASLAEDIDVVITDMQMPNMDGVELAQKIKMRYTGLPIILLSSIGDDNRSRYRDLFFAIINKPVKPQQLWTVIESAIKGGVNAHTFIPSIVSRQVLSSDFAEKHPLTILIAEDNLINQKLTVKALDKLGYSNVSLAEDGQEAFDKWTTLRHDVIFMDVQMPILDGLEATKKIRHSPGSQPIIISMTANAMQEDKDICIAAGMDDYLAKPVRLEELVHALEKAFALKSVR